MAAQDAAGAAHVEFTPAARCAAMTASVVLSRSERRRFSLSNSATCAMWPRLCQSTALSPEDICPVRASAAATATMAPNCFSLRQRRRFMNTPLSAPGHRCKRARPPCKSRCGRPEASDSLRAVESLKTRFAVSR